MSNETFLTGYNTLFEVEILHDYFISICRPDGSVIRSSDSSDDPQVEALRQQYNVERFWNIVPDTATQEYMTQRGLLIKHTGRGFRLLEPWVGVVGSNNSIEKIVAAPIAFNTEFSFLAYLTDPLFSLYTDLSMEQLAVMKPSVEHPSGQFYSVSFDHVDEIHDRYLFYNLLFDATPQEWTGSEALPFAGLTIRHNANKSYYQPYSTLYPYIPQARSLELPISYRLPLPSRTVTWIYKGSRIFDGDKEGSYEMLHYGGTVNGNTPIPDGLSSPTLANTFYVKDDPNNPDPNAPRHFETYIY